MPSNCATQMFVQSLQEWLEVLWINGSNCFHSIQMLANVFVAAFVTTYLGSLILLLAFSVPSLPLLLSASPSLSFSLCVVCLLSLSLLLSLFLIFSVSSTKFFHQIWPSENYIGKQKLKACKIKYLNIKTTKQNWRNSSIPLKHLVEDPPPYFCYTLHQKSSRSSINNG